MTEERRLVQWTLCMFKAKAYRDFKKMVKIFNLSGKKHTYSVDLINGKVVLSKIRQEEQKNEEKISSYVAYSGNDI